MTYEVRFTSTALRALAEKLPEAVAFAALNLIEGDLAGNPQRVGKRLVHPLEHLWSARRGEYRVLYTVDAEERLVVVQDVRHRRDAYR